MSTPNHHDRDKRAGEKRDRAGHGGDAGYPDDAAHPNDSARLDRLQRLALLVGVAGLIACVICYLVRREAFFRVYLTGYLYCLGVPIGSLAIAMLHRLTGGAWGLLIVRPLEAMTRTLPLAALLFVPVLFGIHQLYPWADPSRVAADADLMAKTPYLNVTGFELRAAAYFLIWIVLSMLFNAWSRHPASDEAAMRRLGTLSGPGLVLVGLADTFASIDWQMSLEPHWYSTMFPVIYAVGQLLASLALAICLITSLTPPGIATSASFKSRIHDLGSLMLMFVMMWAYVSFCQFLLIWAGNLPDEVIWYLPRISGGWLGFALALALLQFALPFLLLLFRAVKRDPKRLGRLAGFMLAIHFVNVFWQVIPAFPPTPLVNHLFDIIGVLLAIAGIGGVLLAMALGQLKNLPPIPWEGPAGTEITSHG